MKRVQVIDVLLFSNRFCSQIEKNRQRSHTEEAKRFSQTFAPHGAPDQNQIHRISQSCDQNTR
jgi:hypothetical protein